MGTTPEHADTPYVDGPQIEGVGRGAFSRGMFASDETLLRMFEASEDFDPVIRSAISAIRRSPEPFVERYVAKGDADMVRGGETNALRWAIDLDANVRRVAYTRGYLERIIQDIATAPHQTIDWTTRDGKPFGLIPLPHWLDRIQSLVDAMAKLRGDRQFTTPVRAHLVKVLADSASVVLERLYRDRWLIRYHATAPKGRDSMFTIIVWAGQANDWNGYARIVGSRADLAASISSPFRAPSTSLPTCLSTAQRSSRTTSR